MKVPNLILFFSFLMASSWALASDQWIPLTALSNKVCSQEKPCFVKHSKSNQSYKIVFDLKKEKKKLHLEKVLIENSKGKQQFNQFENFQIYFEGEVFGLYAVDLNRDGYLDLALQASRSLKFGYSYYYWIFNPKKAAFVQTMEQIEKLLVTGKKQLKSPATLKFYRVDKSFQIKAL